MNGHHLKLLKELSKDNKLSQRELSRKLGVSLGSLLRVSLITHCFPLIAFYMYILTPAGIKSRVQLSRAFLKRKLDEYEMIKMEIEELKREVGPDESLFD